MAMRADQLFATQAGLTAEIAAQSPAAAGASVAATTVGRRSPASGLTTPNGTTIWKSTMSISRP